MIVKCGDCIYHASDLNACKTFESDKRGKTWRELKTMILERGGMIRII